MGLRIEREPSGKARDKGKGKRGGHGWSRSDQGKKTSYADRVAAASSAEKGSPTQGNRSTERGRDN
tara:strand:- start:1161 stop:1358 length:198 start_codon:yes stop_codon:yes gene_type:complete